MQAHQSLTWRCRGMKKNEWAEENDDDNDDDWDDDFDDDDDSDKGDDEEW